MELLIGHLKQSPCEQALPPVYPVEKTPPPSLPKPVYASVTRSGLTQELSSTPPKEPNKGLSPMS